MTLAAIVLMAGTAWGFSGEDLIDGKPWHHEDITYRALVGDSVRYDGAGLSRGAALGVAWHADYVDTYLYNPLYWLQGGNRDRLRAGLVGRPELIKLHFDDVFSTGGITDTWQRYASGTLIGLYWASLQGVSGDVDMAHHVLGASLHAVQDFYAHSTWVDDASRRCSTWAENAPEARELILLSTGAYDLAGSIAPNLHGAYSASCSLVRSSDTDPLAEAICSGYSPFQNSPLCETFRRCAASSAIPVSIGGTLVPDVVRISEPGIALDSTWMAEVQAVNRGVVDESGQFTGDNGGLHFSTKQCEAIVGTNDVGVCDPDPVQLFAGAKDLAIRASMQWVAWLDEAMAAMGPREAAFWQRVKTQSTNVPNQAKAFEDLARVPYQFLTAGPYPVGDPSTEDRPTRPDDAGWYLRLELGTANERYAGTNADISAELAGDGWTQPYLLDHLRGVINPVLGYDDFEPGDKAAYLIGPLPGQPSSLRFVNTLPDISDAFWRDYAEAVDDAIDLARQTLTSLLAGAADLVGSGKHFLATSEVRALLTGVNAADRTLSVDGGIQGAFDIAYRLRPLPHLLSAEESQQGWLAFEVELRRLDGIRESTVDRFSDSDEPFVIFLVSPLNGRSDPVRAYLSDPVPDFDANESHVFARRTGSSSIVKVPPEGGVVISAQIFESDDETAPDRDRLRRIYESGLKAVEGEEDQRLLAALNAALAADWQPAEVNAFAFRRGDAPMAGTVLATNDLPVLEGNTNGAALGLDFSAVRTLGSPAGAFIAWTAEPADPKLTLAGQWYAHNLPCRTPVPVQPVEFFIEDGNVSAVKVEGDGCVVAGEEALTGTYENGVIDARLNLGGEEEAVDESPPLFQDPSVDPNLDLEGRWLIEWDAEANEPPGYAELSRGPGWDCSQRCAFKRDPNANWAVFSYNASDSNYGAVSFAGRGAFTVKWDYFHFGYQGGVSDTHQISDDFMMGNWRQADRSGSETWTRIEPVVRRIDAVSKVEDSVSPGERPLRVVTDYNGDPGESRGNLPRFVLAFSGANLWGPNYYWLPRSSGLEITGGRYVCTHSDGKVERSVAYRSCLMDRGVDGFELDILVLASARPGPQTLLFNGLEIPFDLELPADPGTATLAVESCSVIRERDPVRSPPLLFTRYNPNPAPKPAE